MLLKESASLFESKKLLLVGHFEASVVSAALLKAQFPPHFEIDIEILSSPDFRRNYCSETNSPEKKVAQSRDGLVVVVTSELVVLEQSDVNNSDLFIIGCNDESYCNVSISEKFSSKNLASSINMGFEFLLNRRQLYLMADDIVSISQERKDLSEIGIALSAERDLDTLLTLVLTEGCKLGNCEAASLYLLLGDPKDNQELLFKLTYNSKIDFDFVESRFPLTNQSLSGYVALTGEILNIADAYELSAELPYQFDKSFDNATGYRTRELLVLPMRNHNWKIIGVLQFINQLDSHDRNLAQRGFNLERQELLMSLASQAAVAIDNSQLIENIQSLFEGFVSASVKAIESRDPVTSGHSFRVAEFTTGLATSIDRCGDGIYKKTFFDNQQMREIRYASLLHDFGKVGVQENVLLKANKLHGSRFRYLDLKIEWQKQMIQRKFYQSVLNQSVGVDLTNWQQAPEFQQMQQQIEKLDRYQKILMRANEPSLLEESIAVELQHLLEYQMDDTFPYGKSLLSDKDFLSLSVTRGSLTEQERQEIQSHVVHTEAFLREIPWTEELSDIPIIAASHHEKLDGTGYPRGIENPQIPIPSKIMAVADIFDALTASDRPYKKAVKTELALDILKEEANNGKLCSAMVETFIEAKVYQKSFKN